MSGMILGNYSNLPSCPQGAEDAWNDIVTSESYLPRVQVCGPTSDLAKRRKIASGNLAMIVDKENFIDLGQDFECIPFAYRNKAVRLVGDKVLNYFNTKSPEFVSIMNEANAAASGMTGCLYGPEFLLWIPKYKKFATFLYGTKSSRREAADLKALIRTGAIVSAEFIERKAYSWYVQRARVSPTTFTPEDLPDEAELVMQINKFVNPVDSDVAQVSEGEAAGGRDR